MEMRPLALIRSMWSTTTVIKGDTLLGNAKLQRIKTTSTMKAQEGVCLWKLLLPKPWCPVMVLVVMIEVIKQRKIVDKCKKGLGYESYNAIPPPCIGNFMPPKPDLSFTGLDEFANKSEVENCPKSYHDDGSKPSNDDGKKVDENLSKGSECKDQEKDANSTNNVSVAGTNGVNVVCENISIEFPFDPNMPALEDVSTFDLLNDDEDDGAMADMSNLDTTIQSSHDDGSKPSNDDGKKVDENPSKGSECKDQEKDANSTNNVSAAGTNGVNVVCENISIEFPFDPNMPALEDVSTFDLLNDDEDDGAMADMSNLDTTIQEEPKNVIQALKDPSWIDAMQKELLQFKLQEV
nr:hypothetical protein [Tanacetum cinerariifolium]